MFRRFQHLALSYLASLVLAGGMDMFVPDPEHINALPEPVRHISCTSQARPVIREQSTNDCCHTTTDRGLMNFVATD
jgi:hypothetical protein